jgi:ribonuclease E
MFSFYNRKTVERKLKEKLKDDRARIQFGRIGNFGLLEMTRQRLRESSVKWNMVLSIDSFSLKIVKKGEELAFSNKAKIVDVRVPSKVKAYIYENLSKEINHFKKKYKLEFNIIADENLAVPEYKINLLNKNKKIIKKVENIEKIEMILSNKNRTRKNFILDKNNKNFRSQNKFRKYSKNKRNVRSIKKAINY